MATPEGWRIVGFAALGMAALVCVALLILIKSEVARRRRARPAWPRMLAETTYFRQSLQRIFRARGYVVQRYWTVKDSIERQEREVVFLMARRGELVVALCGRWVIPITSEVVTRFEHALATTQAHRGMIVTTSWFSQAALDCARGLPVELLDSAGLGRWMDEIWA